MYSTVQCSVAQWPCIITGVSEVISQPFCNSLSLDVGWEELSQHEGTINQEVTFTLLSWSELFSSYILIKLLVINSCQPYRCFLESKVPLRYSEPQCASPGAHEAHFSGPLCAPGFIGSWYIIQRIRIDSQPQSIISNFNHSHVTLNVTWHILLGH